MNPVSVKITYKLTEKDVREALVRHRGLGAKVTTVVGVFTCLMGASAFALDSTHSPLALIPFLFGALMLSLPWLQAQQMFRKGGSPLRDEVAAEISDSGFFGANSVSSSNSTWGAFVRYAESKNLFLVYRSEMLFNIVPKRAFAAGEEEAVRGLLEEHLGGASKASRRKVPLTALYWVVIFGAAVVLWLVMRAR
jgi:hypothetical protein